MHGEEIRETWVEDTRPPGVKALCFSGSCGGALSWIEVGVVGVGGGCLIFATENIKPS